MVGPSSSVRKFTKPINRAIDFGHVKRGCRSEYYQYFLAMPDNFDFEVTNVALDTLDIKVVRAMPVDFNFEVVSVTMNTQSFKIVPTSKKMKRWEVHTFDVTFKPKLSEPLGRYTNKIKVFYRDRVNGPIRSIDIPVTATIESEINVAPEWLFFGVVKEGDSLERSVTLTSTGRPCRIKSIANPIPNSLDLKVVESEKGQQVLACLHNVPKGCHKWLVTIETDNMDHPYVVVPAWAYLE